MIPSKETLDILAVIMYAAMVPYLILGIRNTIRHYIRNGDFSDAVFLGIDDFPNWKSNPLKFGVFPAFSISVLLPLVINAFLLSWFATIPLALTAYLIVSYTIRERRKVEFLEQLKGESND